MKELPVLSEKRVGQGGHRKLANLSVISDRRKWPPI
jgi:hypothetical protein